MSFLLAVAHMNIRILHSGSTTQDEDIPDSMGFGIRTFFCARTLCYDHHLGPLVGWPCWSLLDSGRVVPWAPTCFARAHICIHIHIYRYIYIYIHTYINYVSLSLYIYMHTYSTHICRYKGIRTMDIVDVSNAISFRINRAHDKISLRAVV